MWTKATYFVNDFEIKGEDYLPYVRALLARAPVVTGVLRLALRAWHAGAHALLLQRRLELVALLGGLLLCVLAANVFGFVMSRFRLPAVIPLALLAAPGLVSLAELGRDGTQPRRLRAAALTIAVAVLAGWLAFRPALAHTDRGFLRRAEENRQLSITAEQAAARLRTADDDSARGYRSSSRSAAARRRSRRFSALRATMSRTSP